MSKPAKPLPSQARLRELFDYDPETGKLRNNTQRNSRALKGQETGNLDKSGYIFLWQDKEAYLAHRVIWKLVHGTDPDMHIDHINGNRSDNRLSNLRAVSRQENRLNQKKHSDNTSGVTGVCWHKSKAKWLARINYEGKSVALGYHRDWFDAVCARMSANNRYGFHVNHGRR